MADHTQVSFLFFGSGLTSDGPPEDPAGGAVVEGTPQGLDVAAQAQELEVLQLVPVEVAGHLDALGPHDHDLVAVEQELGHDGGQAAHQVTPAVNDDGLEEEREDVRGEVRLGT